MIRSRTPISRERKRPSVAQTTTNFPFRQPADARRQGVSEGSRSSRSGREVKILSHMRGSTAMVERLSTREVTIRAVGTSTQRSVAHEAGRVLELYKLGRRLPNPRPRRTRRVVSR